MSGPGAKPDPNAQPKLRLDKWLWAARFFKSRDLAVDVIESGRLRINRLKCRKPGHGVAVGDVLTFPQGNAIRVVRVLALTDRRGPAQEAQLMYDDLDVAGDRSAASPLE